MKLLKSRITWGVLLILGGLLFLLHNLEVIVIGNLIWGLLFALGGLIFLSVYISHREHWWSLIPGFVLLSLAAVIIIGDLFPDLETRLGGSIFLAGIGLAFWLVYLTDRRHWWAVIPGGVLFTLAVVAGLDTVIADTGGIFFLGLGLTFALVGILPTPEGQMRWAFIPAVILSLMGVLIIAAAGEMINIILPLFLILIGVFLVIRTLVPRRGT
jgi:hypothetical protein